MNLILGLLPELLIIILCISLIWVIVKRLFRRHQERVYVFFGAVLVYFLVTYLLIPQVIRLVLSVKPHSLTEITRARHGLPADPINVVLVGSASEIETAFAAAGWYIAEPLNVRTGTKMAMAFVWKSSYPNAPFSSLYLFGRKQDLGFEQPIGQSPRQRHHIRLWSAQTNTKNESNNIWVGAATEDTGFGLSRLTYQISHREDKNIDEERDYIVQSFVSTGLVKKIEYFFPEKISQNKYQTDGRVAYITLWQP